MITIGLTGPSGAGKGVVGGIFGEYGFPVLDTDVVSREVTGAGSECLAELVTALGNDILAPDGTLDRRRTSEIAFSDGEKYKMLNSITHRHILEACRRWLSVQRTEAAVIDAPLLVESGFDGECDIVVSVLSPVEHRIARLMKRDSLPEEMIRLRLSRQHNDDFYRTHSDFVIENDDGMDLLREQVMQIINLINTGGMI